jgi:hypothetical protein
MKVLLAKVSKVDADGSALLVLESDQAMCEFITVPGLDVTEGQAVEVIIQPLQTLRAGVGARHAAPTRPATHTPTHPKVSGT